VECVGERGVCGPSDLFGKLLNRGGGGDGGGKAGADDDGDAVGRR